jgi:pyruvate dehydrogenase E1 component alpha subunit
LIEALTYRLADHTTADDSRRYRDEDEVAQQWKGEPLTRLRLYLTAQGAWSREQEETFKADCSGEVEAAVAAYLADTAQPVAALFDYLYAALPRELTAQRAQAIEEAEAGGDG